MTRCTEHLHNRVKNTHSHTIQLLFLLLVTALYVVGSLTSSGSTNGLTSLKVLLLRGVTQLHNMGFKGKL